MHELCCFHDCVFFTSRRGSSISVSGLLVCCCALPLRKHHWLFVLEIHCWFSEMSPPLSLGSVCARVDALEKLVMTNLPRVASIESWQRDCMRDMCDMQDWMRSKGHTVVGHNFRLSRLEQRTGTQPPATVTATQSDPIFDGAADPRPFLPEPAPAGTDNENIFTDEAAAR